MLQNTRRALRSTVERTLVGRARLVRRALLAAGRERAPHLPEIVQIESTNICNAKCVFCPRDEMKRRQGVMDMALYRKIVDECVALGITHVRMHNYGEPFIDRQLVEKVRYAKERGVPQVGMISNGSLITDEVARGMIDAGLDAINISVDASGKEVFDRTRIGLKYDKVIANIERLLRLRIELGRTHPKMILSFVRQNDSDDERAFIEHWRARVDKVHVTDLHNWAGHSQPRSRRQFSLLPALADLHGPLGRTGVALLRRFRRPRGAGRPQDVHDPRGLERRGVPPRAPAAPPERRPRHLHRLRPAKKRLAALDLETRLTPARLEGRGPKRHTGMTVRLLARPVTATVLAVFLGCCTAGAQELTLVIRDGRVQLSAHNVPPSRILAEWARVGQTKVVNGERVPGPPLTIELAWVSERSALDTILRSASGYVAAPRRVGSDGASLYDRILIMPAGSSSPPQLARQPVRPPPPPSFAQPVPDPMVPETLSFDPGPPDGQEAEQVPPEEVQMPGVTGPGEIAQPFAPGQQPFAPGQVGDPLAPGNYPGPGTAVPWAMPGGGPTPGMITPSPMPTQDPNNPQPPPQ